VALAQGAYAQARALIEDGLARYREIGAKAGVAHALHHLAAVASAEGDCASARALLDESLSLAQALDDKPSMADSMRVLGLVDLQEGRLEAREHLLGSLRLGSGDVRSANSFLIGMAALILQEGAPRFAAQLLGAVQSGLAPLGLAVEPDMKYVHAQTLGKVEAALGATAFKAAWEEGSLWSLPEAVRRASADKN